MMGNKTWVVLNYYPSSTGTWKNHDKNKIRNVGTT